MAQEVILLGATVAQPATDYGGQFLPLTHVEQKLKTVNYRWNPNTLAYEVETVTGGGTGTDVNVTNSSIPVTFAGALPAGANTLGKVDQGVGGASAWKVDGSAATQPVSGTFWQATQPVSGPLTDTQLRATAVPVSGPLTDAQLRASAVPVSNASLPLPSGASTAAKQDTGNTSVASIDTKLPAQGQALAAASMPVVLPAAQITTLTPPAAITGFALEAGHLAAIDTHITKANTDAVGVTSISTFAGKSPIYVPIAQSVAGTTLIAAASPSNKHKIVGLFLTLSASGTLKFTDGAGDLTGALDIAAQGGMALTAGIFPYFTTSTTNTALSLVSSGGAARGVVAILTEP